MVLARFARPSVSHLRDRLGVIVALLVPLTALPLASNRSVWWLLWTTLFAFLALLFLLRSGLSEGSRPRVLNYRTILALLLLLPLWAWIQTLPIGSYLPNGLTRMAPGLEAAAGASVSVQPDTAAIGVLRYLGFLLLGALVIEVASRRKRVLRMARITYAGVCLQAIWALIALQLLGDFSPWGPKTAYLGSATGTFVNRNSLATFLGFGLVLGFGLLAERAQSKEIRPTRKGSGLAGLRIADLSVMVGMVFLLLALIATESRLGLVAGLTGAACSFALWRSKSGATTMQLLRELSLLALACLGIILVGTSGEGVATRLLFAERGAVDRLTIYQQAAQMIVLRPWTGFGMDSFGTAFEAFRSPPLLAPVTYDLAHNTYLTLWIEFGLVFGSIPILVLAIVGVILWRRMHSETGFPGLAIAGLGALVLGSIHSLGDFSLEIPANVYLLVLILGLGLGQRAYPKGNRAITEKT